MTLPNHIAIIMDGNGRWGKKKYKNKLLGHKYGIENIKNIIKYCIYKKINHLTLYAFSKDNLKRSAKEVSNLFSLFEKYFRENEYFFDEKKISINVIGEKLNLPNRIIKLINKINKKKINNPSINLNIAFNYSSKLEIVTSIKNIIKLKKKINIKNVESELFTFKSKDPEILIRTGARCRLSDFMLWQLSYTEIFFLRKLWPEFKPYDLNLIIKKFKKIKRNFGS